jgi:tetratricopeptide (TPR) repeat protein
MIALLVLMASWPVEWYQEYSSINWDGMEQVSAGYGDTAVELAVKAISQFGAGTGNPVSVAEDAVALDSTDYRTWTALAIVGMEQDSVRMDSLFKTAFSLADGTDPVLSEAYGYWLFSMGNSAAAVVHTSASLNADSTFGPAWLTLSLALVELNRIDEALIVTADAVNRLPDCSSVLQQYGQVLEEAEDTAGAIDVYRRVIDTAPERVSAYVSLGLLLESRKKTGEAIKVYREALRISPQYGWVWSQLASCFLEKQRSDLADSFFVQSLEFSPDDSRALYQLAKLRKDGDPVYARQLFEHVVQIDPDFFRAWQELAFLYEAEDDFSRAESALRKCVELEPQPWLYGELGWVLENTARYGDAAVVYETGISMDDQYLFGWQRRGDIFLISGDSCAASRWYSRALQVLEDGDPWIWVELGSLAVMESLTDSAEHCFTNALELDPDFSTAWLNLARVQRINDELDKSLVSVDHYLSASSDSVVAAAEEILLLEASGEDAGLLEESMLQKWPDAWISAGWSAFDSYYSELSMKCADRAFQSAPEDPWQLINLGELYGSLEASEKQKLCYQLASEKNTDDYMVAVRIADHYYDQAMASEAITLLTRAFDRYQWNETVATALAEAYLFDDQFDEAEKLLLQVVGANPSSAFAVCYLGLIQENRGDTSGALDWYLQALRLEPGYSYAEDRLRYISSDSYDPELLRSRARPLNWSVWIDLSSKGGNTDEQQYGGGGDISCNYGSLGSSISLEVSARSEIKNDRDIRKTAWASLSAEYFVTDHLYAGASSSWDRQPITVRPWQVSSYMAAGWKSWPASWIWFAPETGAGLVNTKWSTAQGKTDELTAYISLSIWASSSLSWLPSLWLSGSVYLPPGNVDLLVADAVGEVEFNMSKRISLILGASLDYTRTPVVETWKSLDSEVYIRLRF